VVRGGKNIYGVPLGILMLQSRFPRIPGDAGNASTWAYPVSYRVVAGAAPDRVVRSLRESDLLPRFIDGALELQRLGVSVVSTNCGFLALYQHEVQAALEVPFVSSSLLQVRPLEALMPSGRSVGIITIERRSLTGEHLKAVGLSSAIPVVGMEEVGGYFTDVILGDRGELDVERARKEHIAAAKLLLQRHPGVGAIVLECTNMPPYARDVARATGLPVFDITSALDWAVAGYRRMGYPGWM
jgi:Asp/Glu/Hydantoin racemase